MDWFVYLLKCVDNSLYCGVTTDVDARLAKHNSGKGAKYTRSRLPVTLMVVSSNLSKRDAFKLEYAIKKQPAAKKLEVLNREAAKLRNTKINY